MLNIITITIIILLRTPTSLTVTGSQMLWLNQALLPTTQGGDVVPVLAHKGSRLLQRNSLLLHGYGSISREEIAIEVRLKVVMFSTELLSQLIKEERRVLSSLG